MLCQLPNLGGVINTQQWPSATKLPFVQDSAGPFNVPFQLVSLLSNMNKKHVHGKERKNEYDLVDRMI